MKTAVLFLVLAAAAGQQFDVFGAGFSGVTSVELDGVGLSFTTVSDTLLRVTVAAGVTTGPLRVTGPCAAARTPRWPW